MNFNYNNELEAEARKRKWKGLLIEAHEHEEFTPALMEAARKALVGKVRPHSNDDFAAPWMDRLWELIKTHFGAVDLHDFIRGTFVYPGTYDVKAEIQKALVMIRLIDEGRKMDSKWLLNSYEEKLSHWFVWWREEDVKHLQEHELWIFSWFISSCWLRFWLNGIPILMYLSKYIIVIRNIAVVVLLSCSYLTG